jgi:hypothetical protein
MPVMRWVPLALLLLAGCGTPPPATVSGSVHLHGQPLAGGIICFSPDPARSGPGKVVSAEIQSDGTYRLPDGVAPGWYRVSLTNAPVAHAAESFSGPSFPAELRRPDRSGLVREVQAGREHRFDFFIVAKQ